MTPFLSGEKGIEHAEQLINSRSGRIHLFPVVPDGATVAFRGMQARGGFEVSAECVAGRATYVRVEARRSVTCRVMNPWPGSGAGVREEATGRLVAHDLDAGNGECIVFSARAEEEYLIERVA